MPGKELEILPVEIRFIPQAPEEIDNRQKKLTQLLLLGAIKYSKSSTENPLQIP